MSRVFAISSARASFAAAMLMLLPLTNTARAQSYQILHSFTGGSDGEAPTAPLIEDNAGNLYGTTLGGGAEAAKHGRGSKSCKLACGTVFKLAPNGILTVLHTFTDEHGDGSGPYGPLIADKVGNLYGTTRSGGDKKPCPHIGCGTLFKIAVTGSEQVLYKFASISDGVSPLDGLVADGAGNFYGTTWVGGSNCNCGTVFELTPSHKHTVLHAFTDGSDGAYPYYGSLIFDQAGNLYGTTAAGGGTGCIGLGCGTVFKVAPNGTETVLYAFTGGNDGASPLGGLIADNSGNLYGTAAIGGVGTKCTDGPTCGTVFKLSQDGTETVLHYFTGGSDGSSPAAALVADGAGNLYGTTTYGGSAGVGTIFKIAADGTETILHAFGGGSDGAYPATPLITDNAGSLYGTTVYGGGTSCGSNGCGTVFKVQE